MNETSYHPAVARTKFRYLRIAFSAICAIIGLLLILLWVRSYWWNDMVSISFNGQRAYLVRSVDGELTFFAPTALRAGLQWSAEPAMGMSHRPQSFLGFRWSISPAGRWPVIPHWLPPLLIGTFAALPWTARRFSLRTLLIAMTLVAVLLGAAVWALQ